SQMGHYAVGLLTQGIGNRVVGLKDNKVVDYDIQEALRMTKPFEDELYEVAHDISF
ncbi:MAG: pfkA, partial [Oscillospiraceae bacterium]|nr:pfkA [Oscillospiraceae bacterium]